jgi:hypothetical protein
MELIKRMVTFYLFIFTSFDDQIILLYLSIIKQHYKTEEAKAMYLPTGQTCTLLSLCRHWLRSKYPYIISVDACGMKIQAY